MPLNQEVKISKLLSLEVHRLHEGRMEIYIEWDTIQFKKRTNKSQVARNSKILLHLVSTYFNNHNKHKELVSVLNISF